MWSALASSLHAWLHNRCTLLLYRWVHKCPWLPVTLHVRALDRLMNLLVRRGTLCPLCCGAAPLLPSLILEPICKTVGAWHSKRIESACWSSAPQRHKAYG